MSPIFGDDFTSRLMRYQENLIDSFNLKSVNLTSPGFENLVSQIEANTRKFNAMLDKMDIARVLGELAQGRPQNYSELKIDDQFELIDRSRVGNFGTVEVIPQKVIDRLLNDPLHPASLNSTLLDSENEISETLSDLAERLFISFPNNDFITLFYRSLAAFKAGHYEASQSLSTCLWDSILCEKADHRDSITYIKPLAVKPDIEEMESFAPLYDYGAYGPALKAYQTPSSKDLYSRNGTVHRANLSSINKLNSIKSITIAGGLIGREFRPS